MFQKFFILAVLAIAICGCNNTTSTNTAEKNGDSANVREANANNTLPDISGVYRLPETRCDLMLTIIKENNAYKYYFKGQHLDIQGVALLENQGDIVYITFDGPIGNYPAKTVSGQYNNKTVTIQNYGNSMNEYHYFTDCDEKYLEFKKD